MWAIVGNIFVHKLHISAIPLAICVFIQISFYKNKFIKYQEHVLCLRSMKYATLYESFIILNIAQFPQWMSDYIFFQERT